MPTQRPRKGVPADRDDILENWVTIEEAATIAGVPIATVISWIASGKVEAFHFVTETSTVH